MVLHRPFEPAKLISHNPDRSTDKEPLAANKDSEIPNVVRLMHFKNVDEELRWIAGDIGLRSETERGCSVVLARTKKLAEGAAQVLNAAGIAAALAIRKNEFESTPLRWLHALLRLANARADREQLRKLCKAFYELEGVNIRVEDVTAASSARGGDLLRSWTEEAMARENLEPYTRDFLALVLK